MTLRLRFGVFFEHPSFLQILSNIENSRVSNPN